MRISEWRAQRRVSPELANEEHFGEAMEGVYEGPGVIYPGEGVIEGPTKGTPDNYTLTIANCSYEGDLESMEAILFAWQTDEGFWE